MIKARAESCRATKTNRVCDANVTPEACPRRRPKGSRAELVSRYRSALRSYLDHKDNRRLHSAYDLGCVALRSGMGVFDMARLHEETLAKALTRGGSVRESAQQARAAETFLLDALSPFEAARRGIPEAYVYLAQLNKTLEERTKALATIVARQLPMEEALRASNQRYFKLFQQARTMKQDIRRHPAKMILAQEEERKRVSRELHDEIGQVLAAVNVALGILKKQAGHNRTFQKQVAATQALLEQSMESVHRFARELRPEMLDLFGPFEAIRSYVRAFAERTGITAIIQSKVDLDGLDSEQEIVLFRVAQESITNISKHAQATQIHIRFRRLAQKICMEIQDNGRSFSVEDQLRVKGAKRLGLLGMQERVRLVRGDFTIESAPGRGTKVQVQFPLLPHQGAPSNGNGNGERLRPPPASPAIPPKALS
jgi:signal transduction histidine kinase